MLSTVNTVILKKSIFCICGHTMTCTSSSD